MGHVRLGPLPRTRKWQQVVELIRVGAGAAQVATATLRAAELALAGAAEDLGVVETVWVLTRLPLAARCDDFVAALRRCGVDTAERPGLLEIVAGVTRAVDAAMPNCEGRTDLGEMAQMAAAETLTGVVGGGLRSLFDTDPEDVRRALAGLATEAQFGRLAKSFFARFTNRCLDYFLSKALSQQVGQGQRFRTLSEQGEFTRALDRHCREAAVIVEEFSGGWFSKRNRETGGDVTRRDAAAFTAHAMTKLTAELKQGARGDGQ